MDLTIVIPVLNEEKSVGFVARDCVQAREAIIRHTSVEEVNIIVVSDGSTDRSVEIARSIDEVTTVALERNQGYGAAIQAGWHVRPADLLAFLDGDGTCRADFFVPLIQALEDRRAEIALGSRMGLTSKMPRIRRIGNWLFAALLGVLSRTEVTDSASGMRVVRKTALPKLGPLPAGLHFTPAMSARAILGGLAIVEIPMPYSERVGRSKLDLVRDGIRFVGSILAAALYLRPSRLTLPVVALMAVCSTMIMSLPIRYYVAHGALEEWMIYRFLFVALIADLGVVIFCATLVAEHMIALGLLRYGAFIHTAPWWWGRRGLAVCIGLAGVLLAAGILLILPGLRDWLATGRISFERMHWSRVIVAAFTGLSFLQLVATRLLIALSDALDAGQRFLLESDRA